MPLSSGHCLGPYEILSPIGSGGMGDVYQARDTRLGRTVAIKVLADELLSRSEHRARFEREARTVSRLSHPHLCALFDVGEQDGVHFLVMEYLEGQTLADLLRAGPLTIAEALRYGAEIAEALSAAHRAGVVHRDLKPANVMITSAGAKLLDFGLARISLQQQGVENVPTIALDQADPLTREGTILGTFPYMSPEQVEGKEADSRSDVFSLGAVLYEMLTGLRAFSGSSAASVMAAVLKEEPEPIGQARPLTPALLEHLVARCLAKDAEDRWQNARDLAAELRWVAGTDNGTDLEKPIGLDRPQGVRSKRAIGTFFLIGVGVGVLLGWLGFEYGRKQTPEEQLTFQVTAPTGSEFGEEVNSRSLGLSPDGKTLAVVLTAGETSRIALRDFSDPAVRILEGTDGANSPFWSPDSASIAFFAKNALKKVSASGGAVQTVCPVEGVNSGAWAPDGTIVFTQSLTKARGIFTVPASGDQAPVLLVPLEKLGRGWPRFPQILPGGKRVLFHQFSESTDGNALFVADLNSGDVEMAQPLHSRAEYDAGSGRLLYLNDGTLVARPFDLELLRLQGEAKPVAENLPTFVTGWAPFSVSPAGVVAYRSGRRLIDLVWRDRQGLEIGRVGVQGTHIDVVLSPDQSRAVVETDDPAKGESDLWLVDLSHGIRQRMTDLPGSESSAIWSPDGTEILFVFHGSTSANQQEGIYRLVVSTGEMKRLEWAQEGTWDWSRGWSPSGEMLYQRFRDAEEGSLWMASLENSEPSARQVIPATLEPDWPWLSRDGQWIAFQSGRSEPGEVFISRFDREGAVAVSSGGAIAPRWGATSKELFFLAQDGSVVATSLQHDARTTVVNESRTLFSIPERALVGVWDVTSDGQRFLFLERIGDPIPVTVTLGWRESLGEAD